jgi:hypothetical protein
MFMLALTIMSVFAGCGGDSSTDPIVTPSGPTFGGGSPTPVGAAVSMAWDPAPDSSVFGYLVHYGPQSPNSSGSCNYSQSAFVSSPSATITGLAHDTLYYFAVSAYNGVESTCTNEVSTVTSSPV